MGFLLLFILCSLTLLVVLPYVSLMLVFSLYSAFKTTTHSQSARIFINSIVYLTLNWIV